MFDFEFRFFCLKHKRTVKANILIPFGFKLIKHLLNLFLLKFHRFELLLVHGNRLGKSFQMGFENLEMHLNCCNNNIVFANLLKMIFLFVESSISGKFVSLD